MPDEIQTFRDRSAHWLFGTLWRYRGYYANAAIATLLVNALSLAFFIMNVYDRVVPNFATVTLWSLAIGVSLAMLLEGVTRFARSYLLDLAGKKADLAVGSMLFRQALSVRMERKPASPGTFANHLREFDSVRDFVTSAMLSAIADLPFVLLFVVSMAVQWPLARIMNENLRESSLKQGVLIESIEGIETLKAVSGLSTPPSWTSPIGGTTLPMSANTPGFSTARSGRTSSFLGQTPRQRTFCTCYA